MDNLINSMTMELTLNIHTPICINGMASFTDKSSPLGAIWYAGHVLAGRKSRRQIRFEKSLVSLKSQVLFDHLIDAQNDISLHTMSQLLYGFTKIVNIQSLGVYQNTIHLLSSIHREMGVQRSEVDLDPKMTNIRKFWITLPEDPYLVEHPYLMAYPFDVIQPMDMTNETLYERLTVSPQVDGITLSPQNAQAMDPTLAIEANNYEALKDNMDVDMNQQNIGDEFAPGSSRQPHRSRSHSSLGMNNQMAPTDNDNNMDDYMDWSELFQDFSLEPPQNNSDANRSNPSTDGNQRVPVISPQNEQQDPTGLVDFDALDVDSSLWDISGFSIPPSPLVLPPAAFPPINAPAQMDEYDQPEMDYNDDNNDTFVPRMNSPMLSIQTDEYSQIVPRVASNSPPPRPPPRRRRNRRRLLDLDSTILHADDFTDTNAIIMARSPDEMDHFPGGGRQSHGHRLKLMVNQYRMQIQQPMITISHPTNFWLREARSGRHMNTVIEQGRRLEHGRNRDPHSHDDMGFSNAEDESDAHRFSGVDVANFDQDGFDFDHMELEDDIHDRRSSNTSTSSTRLQRLQQQLQQGRRLSDSSFGQPLTSSTASDHGRQGTALSDQPDYNELLEIDVDLQAPGFTGQEFYEYLRLATRDQYPMCIFESVYPKGSGGSKRSEVAIAFYKVLACSTLNQLRPEQDEPYGSLFLHFLQDGGE